VGILCWRTIIVSSVALRLIDSLFELSPPCHALLRVVFKRVPVKVCHQFDQSMHDPLRVSLIRAGKPVHLHLNPPQLLIQVLLAFLEHSSFLLRIWVATEGMNDSIMHMVPSAMAVTVVAVTVVAVTVVAVAVVAVTAVMTKFTVMIIFAVD